jgi:predicted Zn-dependent protease
MYVDDRRRSGCGGAQLVIALIIAVGSIVSYFGHTSKNPITGETQHIDMSVDQEIALGMQAAPRMASEYGGEDPDPEARQLVAEVGNEIVSRSDAGRSDYKFQFHALADDQTVNAFALPGGQVFITRGLLTKLKSRGQLAGVLGHECGHVIARHSAEQIAQSRLAQGLTGAAVIATYNPNDYRSRGSAAVAAMIAQLVNLKFSRNDELEADKLGVALMSEAGYDPRAMIEVMEVLKQVSSGGSQPEFFATHPNPENREEKIRQVIKERFPDGVPHGLKR